MKKRSRPLIGIIPDHKEGTPTGYSSKEYYALRTNHVEMINKSGGSAIILTYDYDLIDFYLENFDGLMIVGGYFDIDPKHYGEERHPLTKANDVRENFEFEIASKALKSEIPLLGICSGMQLINILHGGAAFQYLPDEEGFIEHEQKCVEGFNSYSIPYHEVEIEKDSKLFEIIGEEKINTNSSHRQAIKRLGQGLSLSARAFDGVIEGIEKTNHPFCIGVQWHPEFETSEADKRIFDAFVKASSKAKTGQ